MCKSYILINCMLLLIAGLVMFIGLVVVHEFGHFIMARRNSVEVEEFGIGFPPLLWKKRVQSKKGDFDFTLNALPLGGFVRLKGENDSNTEKGSFGAANLPAKVKIMVAGVAMNLIVAFLLLTFVALVGMPKLVENQFTVPSDTRVVTQQTLISYVEPGSPADKAGLKTMDSLVAINGTEVKSADEFPKLTESLAGEKVNISFIRAGEKQSSQVHLNSREDVENSKDTDKPKGYLGVIPSEYIVKRSTWSSPIVAAGLIKQFTVLTFQGLGSAISSIFQGEGSKASQQVAGPVGIFVILKDGSMMGYQFVLLIIAVISLTLAIMNVLPIPALDGGRLFVTLFFRALHKPLTAKTENLIHGTGFALLMALFVLITVIDVRRFF